MKYDGTKFIQVDVGGIYNGIDIDVGDFNNDGLIDIVAGGNNCWNSFYFLNNGQPSGTWSSIGLSQPLGGCYWDSRVAAGDIDGNGNDDIAYSITQYQYISWFSGGAGATGVQYPVLQTSSTPQVAIGRLYNNQGVKNHDIVYIDTTGLRIYGVCAACPACASGRYIDGSFTCNNCPAGYSSIGPGASTCTICPVGSVSTAGGLCTPCPAGSYSTSIGGTSCTACPAGQVSPGGSVPCSTCPENYVPITSLAYCARCTDGSYSAPGFTSCCPCPPGTARCGDQFTCNTCSPGSYAGVGFASCQPCPPGSASAAAAPSCTTCTAGTYASGVAGSPSCTTCPAGTTSPVGAFYCH